jgi:ubiquinone/menaquinone biosynthesis C-methylase UbiE
LYITPNQRALSRDTHRRGGGIVTSTFHARSAAAYEQFMGRWSRRLAGPFIEFAGLAEGDRVIDVGCGTGGLSLALVSVAEVGSVVGVDLSEVYLEDAERKNVDKRLTFEKGDATALPFSDNSFDKAMSMLVLQFVPDADIAIDEMRRVVRSGGVVSAAVWDSFGGMPAQRMFWDTAASLGIAASKDLSDFYFRPMTRHGEMANAWIRSGLQDVVQSSLTIRMDFESFYDYWAPIEAGEAALGKFVAGLTPSQRVSLEKGVRANYLSGQRDGPRSFAAIAWACKGVVP